MKKMFAEVAIAISVAALMRVAIVAERGETFEDAAQRIVIRGIGKGRAVRAGAIRNRTYSRVTTNGEIDI